MRTSGLWIKIALRCLASSFFCFLVMVPLARADSLRLVFPTTATTMSLPYYVDLKKGWLADLQIEEIYVTGDANASRVLISKQADIAVIGTLNTLLAVGQGASIKAINSWQPRIDFHLIAR